MNMLQPEDLEERPLFPERTNPSASSPPAPHGSPPTSQFAPESASDPVVARLAAIEQILRDLRSYGELQTRELQHESYSFPRILAGILQGVAAVLLGWCIVEFAFVTSQMYGSIAIRALFALVLQVMALTALMWERQAQE